MTLGELIAGLDHADVTGERSAEITSIEYDSRLVRPGALFVAITGFKENGYTYAPAALANGAVAVMGEQRHAEFPIHVRVPNARKALAEVAARFYGYPGKRMRACGVTGTNGKTTTCRLIKGILTRQGRKTGLVTSLIYDTGNEQFSADRTTPESLDLQRLLFLMRKNVCRDAVIEVSSHALSLHRVDNVSFRVAVYTNFTRDHLDFHGTMDEYFKAKAKLLRFLSGPLAYAVINLDVPEFRPLFGDLECSFLAYSLANPKADVYTAGYEIRPDGTTFDLVTPVGTQTVNFPLPGRYNLMNALAATAGALADGADLESVVAGLEEAEPVPGRLNRVDCGQPFGVFVDYAHTPDAIERLCQSARELTSGRLLLLFGCGGDRDSGKRPLMGAAATGNANYVVVTSDNPRTENPLTIIEQIKPGLLGSEFKVEPDRRAAIAAILQEARSGDVVLLAGKGAETYQEIHGVKHPFDDREVAREALAAMGYAASAESTAR